MNQEKVYASFPLPDGSTGYICADRACSWLVDILREVHHMHEVPGSRMLLNIVALTPDTQREYFPASRIYQVDLPENNIPQVSICTMPPAEHEKRIKLARNVMFLSLLPLLKKREIFLFHGGLTVDANGKGCILCGPSGVGKSTAVNKAGKIWEILADDLMFLSFKNGKCVAMPGPTWSSYLLEKTRPVDCDITRTVEVKNTLILSRIGEVGIRKLPAMQTSLMISGSFIEMVTWQSLFLRSPELTAELRKAAFDGISLLTAATQCHCLTSELETDLAPFLRSVE